MACDFATVDTVMLRRHYLLFFIDVTSREVFFAGIPANPTGPWTTQAARNLFRRHADQRPPLSQEEDAASAPPPPIQVIRSTRCNGLINEYQYAP